MEVKFYELNSIKDEDIMFTARRELFEETGAKKYSIVPVCIYSVKKR